MAVLLAQERVELAGGKVLDYAGGLRVMGMLACTRAIGDHDLQEYGVVPDPEVLKLDRSPEDSWLILASDGLWDMLSNEVRRLPLGVEGWRMCAEL
jgi:serine/threonine protein phosphatase PrpC